MKKDVPEIIKVKYNYDRDTLEEVFLWGFNNIIENGYAFAYHDFDLFCAILLRKNSLENLPDSIRDYIIQDGKIRSEVLFNKIALAIEKREIVSKEEEEFYYKTKFIIAIQRKKIVKDEIKRTGINPSKVNLTNSVYYRELLNIIKDFSDLTFINWYIPIVLKFEKFVHIYVKHVEETKFNDGQFSKRSFFDYKHTEILTLIKKILRREENDIKEHFLLNSIGFGIDDDTYIKDYHRGFGKYPPILLGEDKFRLSINKCGFIESFYQIK